MTFDRLLKRHKAVSQLDAEVERVNKGIREAGSIAAYIERRKLDV